MGEKLLKLMKSEGLTSSRLAEILGTGASNISHIISGRSKPGYDLLRKILLCFPRINPDWLLLDAETMFRPEESASETVSTKGDLFSDEASSSHTEAANKEPLSKASDLRPVADQLHSSDLRNMTSPDVRRVIVIYSDRTFESFTLHQD